MKKQIQKRLIVSVLAIFLLSLFPTYSNDVSAETDTLNIEAEGAILVEASTGKILYEKNSDQMLGIASMTKMMTEYLLLEAIHAGQVTWDQEYQVSDYVYRISQNRALSNVPLRADGTYSVKELYQAMAIYSANGATIALTEVVAGSETDFVKLMNEKAAELGLKDYKFVNSTGLNNRDLIGMHPGGTGAEDENEMSAAETAKLAYHLLKNFPEILETASIPKMTFREGTDDATEMPNWNWMLPTLVYQHPEVDGIKTGSTDYAGFGFTGTAERDGVRFITVVLKTDSYKARFDETRKMLDYALDNYSFEELYPANYQLKDQATVPVTKGKEKEVDIQTAKPVSVLVKRGDKVEELYKPTFEVNKELLTEDGELTAPVKKNDKVGEMKLNSQSELNLGFLTAEGEKSMSVDLVAATDVEKSNWFVLMMRGIGGFFGNIWSGITGGIKGLF